MKDFIADFNKNVKSLSIQEWKELIHSKLAFTFITKFYDLNPRILYRARLNIDEEKKPIEFFTHIKELWAPEGSMIKRLGRCNIIGESTLYTATSPTTCLFELSPDEDTEITFMDYDIRAKIENIGIVGCKEIMLLGNDYKRIFGQHFIDNTLHSELLEDMLSSIFKSEHSKEFPSYNLTNAIYQIYTDEVKNDLVPEHIRIPKCNGLIYPSIATNKLLGINIALDPIAARHLFKPVKAYKCKVQNKPDKHHYEMIQTHETVKIGSDGKLMWIKSSNKNTELITDLPIKEGN